MTATLEWEPLDGSNLSEEAILGNPDIGDGVRFWISHMPTCYRRGPFRLGIEVAGGHRHHLWGCFDDQDQPMRWYHKKENALSEAQAIADVLWVDRLKAGDPPRDIGDPPSPGDPDWKSYQEQDQERQRVNIGPGNINW